MNSRRWFLPSALLIASCTDDATVFVPEKDASQIVADVTSDARLAVDAPTADARDVSVSEASVSVDGGAYTAVCGACTGADDCGPDRVCVQVASGSRACLPRCNPDVPLCPGRLRCVRDVALADVAVCAPIGGTCCIDADGDEYGQGVGCRGPDCDDSDPARMGPAEACGRVDAGVDAGRDAGVDAGGDVGVDAGVDAGVDVGVDVGVDAGRDAGVVTGACDPSYVRWDIPAGTVGGPACITSGGGFCEGTGHCSGGTCYTTPPGGCGDSHCGTLRCNDGTYMRERYCSVRATCDGATGIIATGFTW